MQGVMTYSLAGLVTAAMPQVGYCENYSTNQAQASPVQVVANEDGTTENKYDSASLANSTDNVLPLFRMDGDYYKFPNADEVQAAQTDSKDIAEIVEKAKAVLGLNIVQVAKMVGVSRPSLYNHISGKEQPKSTEGYEKLHALLSRIDKEVSGDISSGIKSVLVDGKTLLNRLKVANFDEDEFISAAQTVAKRMEAKSGSTNISKSRQRSVTRFLGSMG